MNNHIWEVLIPVVFVFVWILQHLLRSKEEDQPARRTRPPGSGDRPVRRQASEIDRFLEEVNRRRRQAEERRQTTSSTAAAAIPTVVPARPAVRPPRPARPATTVTGSAPASVRPAARRPAAAPRTLGREVPVAVEVEVPASRVELPEVVAVEVSEVLPPPTVSPAEAPSRFASLLDKPQNIRDALVWREILSPPRCRHYGLREFHS